MVDVQGEVEARAMYKRSRIEKSYRSVVLRHTSAQLTLVILAQLWGSVSWGINFFASRGKAKTKSHV
ncbi:Hypothetical protein CpMEX30_1900 [Corynebacterium pseudotuberculosis]|nr:Hypothetical protein CpE19_1823 [Corynebacterium pseudotuberculosis]APQ54892.1 Hypothetical protein CpMEX30_1900 [Corynebacterium pseudotuberculosis]APQ56975.1 Hypothetical protein CpMEX31_1897 [Corynebacterium pseudotuberculosis]ATB62794.1 Hypothetical protein BFF96_1924 [Corynebacterium pseudotuberculosis]ATD14584.1 hypothetical protein ATN04_11045 [Corynebacterium pseudotuberculosis]